MIQLKAGVTTTTTTRPRVPGCPRRMIPGEEVLRERNLVIRRVQCSDRRRGLARGSCLPVESFIRFRCRPGFRFETRETAFNAQCLRTGFWEHVPRCRRIPTTTTTDRPIITTTTTRPLIPGCPRRMIPDEPTLRRRNLVIVRVRCSDTHRRLRRGHCLPIASNILFRCRPGFRFETEDTRFNALCLRSGFWEHVPRCVRVTTLPRNFNFILKLIVYNKF